VTKLDVGRSVESAERAQNIPATKRQNAGGRGQFFQADALAITTRCSFRTAFKRVIAIDARDGETNSWSYDSQVWKEHTVSIATGTGVVHRGVGTWLQKGHGSSACSSKTHRLGLDRDDAATGKTNSDVLHERLDRSHRKDCSRAGCEKGH